MFYTYVLLSLKDKNFYTGYSEDLKERIKQHNSGKCFSTKYRRPFVLIYYEACLNEEDAKAREKYLKSGMGKRYLKNRMKKYFKKITKETQDVLDKKIDKKEKSAEKTIKNQYLADINLPI